MPVVHSMSFTPDVSCDVVVTVTADYFARRSNVSGGGAARLYRTQGGTTLNAQGSLLIPDGQTVNGRYSEEATFPVVGGTLVEVGLDATRPTIGGYSFSNIVLKAEVIKR